MCEGGERLHHQWGADVGAEVAVCEGNSRGSQPRDRASSGSPPTKFGHADELRAPELFSFLGHQRHEVSRYLARAQFKTGRPQRPAAVWPQGLAPPWDEGLQSRNPGDVALARDRSGIFHWKYREAVVHVKNCGKLRPRMAARNHPRSAHGQPPVLLSCGCGQDLERALALYEWNLTASSAVMQTTAMVEVIVRNSLDARLVFRPRRRGVMVGCCSSVCKGSCRYRTPP